tara:strand:+ start:3605 stop:4330 length:726 start_codon:yes stop_codon:yes gene_type:complete
MEPQSETSSPEEKPKSSKRWILWLIIIAAVFASFKFLPIKEWLDLLEHWIESLGIWGPIVFIAIYILATVLLLPGAAMTPLAGLLFGLGPGTLYVVIASNIGASVAFIIGRYFARDAIAKKTAANEKFGAIDKAVGGEGWKIVGLTRLSPVFPFVLLNYAYGLTSVKWIHFALASLIGMFPGTLLYVYFGSLGRLASGSGDTTTGKIILTVVGLIATILVTVVITKTAKKALDKKTDLGTE